MQPGWWARVFAPGGGKPVPRDTAILALGGLAIVALFYTWHSIWVRLPLWQGWLVTGGCTCPGWAQRCRVWGCLQRGLLRGRLQQVSDHSRLPAHELPTVCMSTSGHLRNFLMALNPTCLVTTESWAGSRGVGSPKGTLSHASRTRLSHTRRQVSAEMYSAPSIVMQTRGHDGALHIFDDFREGYAWLRYNTPDDAIIASWRVLLIRPCMTDACMATHPMPLSMSPGANTSTAAAWLHMLDTDGPRVACRRVRFPA